MDLKDIAKPIIDLGFPIIGTMLGVPELAPVAETLVKKALGLSDDASPGTILSSAQSSPGALAPAETEASAKYQYLTALAASDAAQSQNINATMQAEVAKGQPWYAWRNLWGYSVMIECCGVGTIILKDLAFGNTAGVTVFLGASSFFYTWYGMRIGVLGYIFRGTSNEKIAAVTGETPGIVSQIIKAVKR